MASFNEEAAVICKQIMRNELRNKDLAIQLKENWIVSNIIQVDATYNEVASDSVLMKTLLWHLGSGLSQDPKESRYGNKIISDFDLYFNCTTDKLLNEMLSKLNISVTYEEGLELKRKRNNLAEFVRRTKNIVIENMDLIGMFCDLFIISFNLCLRNSR